jgi:integrase
VSTALRWFAQERAPELASAAQIGFAVGHLLKFFKSDTVSKLTPQRTKEYEAQRKVARGTVRRELAVLSSALNHAIKNGRLLSAPRIILPAPGKARTVHLDEAQIARLLDACRPTPHLYVWTMLALNTGARKSALLELTWTQVQFDQGLIYLNPEEREQTTKGRAIVPISAPLRLALMDAFARRSVRPANRRAIPWEPSPYVVEYRGGRVLDIKKSFAEACARAGLDEVTPHVLRHTAGAIMAKAGIEIHVIGKVLGHSVQKTTELYAHLRPEWLRGAVEALGKATS